MTAKEKIDKFIGETPTSSQISNSITYQFSKDTHINTAYWKGYNDAKIELRDKLYKKENISIEPQVSTNDWSPEYNLTIFGEPIYGKN
jgi:hypothetical protein